MRRNHLQFLQRIKWLGWMLAAEGSQSQHIDPEYHLQTASNFALRKPWNFIGPKRFHFQKIEIF